jgi:hypothetical protein
MILLLLLYALPAVMLIVAVNYTLFYTTDEPEWSRADYIAYHLCTLVPIINLIMIGALILDNIDLILNLEKINKWMNKPINPRN